MAKYTCDSSDAEKIHDWLLNRGGILIWSSINLANPGASWTSPALNADGSPCQKLNWQCGNDPLRVTSLSDVDVATSAQLASFHVGVRRSGMSLKVTDAGSRRIREAVEKFEESTGKPVWHAFDYSATEFNPNGRNCIIMGESDCISMEAWAAANCVGGISGEK